MLFYPIATVNVTPNVTDKDGSYFIQCTSAKTGNSFLQHSTGTTYLHENARRRQFWATTALVANFTKMTAAYACTKKYTETQDEMNGNSTGIDNPRKNRECMC